MKTFTLLLILMAAGCAIEPYGGSAYGWNYYGVRAYPRPASYPFSPFAPASIPAGGVLPRASHAGTTNDPAMADAIMAAHRARLALEAASRPGPMVYVPNGVGPGEIPPLSPNGEPSLRDDLRRGHEEELDRQFNKQMKKRARAQKGEVL